jgi:predicted nucleic acid-binding protein
MRYLLDSDVLIRAKRDHYRFAVFPCFWDWIEQAIKSGLVTSVEAVQQELMAGNDDLAEWVKKLASSFLAPDAATTAAAQRVSAWVQHPDRLYTQAERAKFFGVADYWLVSHALGCGDTVVTQEQSAPNGRKVKIPDVCRAVGVPCITPFDMLQIVGAQFAKS